MYFFYIFLNMVKFVIVLSFKYYASCSDFGTLQLALLLLTLQIRLNNERFADFSTV